MQVKKQEIQNTILMAAQKEFILHGYEGSSMRTIAKKANTTIGNIYHYFPNKESILETLMEEPVKGLMELQEGHMNERIVVHSYTELGSALGELDYFFEDGDMRLLMDERLIILFDLKTTRFVKIRDEFVRACKQHLAWHMGVKDSDSVYVDIMINMFISCVRHVLLEHKDAEASQKEFIKVFRMLCAGLVTNEED